MTLLRKYIYSGYFLVAWCHNRDVLGGRSLPTNMAAFQTMNSKACESLLLMF